MNIISFNANGLRSRLHQLEAIIEKYNPDIIGIQETKVADDQFPIEAINTLGYDVIYHGQKSHYGVALLYRLPLVNSIKGFSHDTAESQRRLVFGQFQLGDKKLNVFNGYFPQGESRDHPQKFPCKQAFYKDLLNRIFSSHAHKYSQSLLSSFFPGHNEPSANNLSPASPRSFHRPSHTRHRTTRSAGLNSC